MYETVLLNTTRPVLVESDGKNNSEYLKCRETMLIIRADNKKTDSRICYIKLVKNYNP